MSKPIKSEATIIHRPVDEIYSFLKDFTNFSHLMPEQVENWQASVDSCSFGIRGLATLGMRIAERLPFSKIVMEGEGKLPFGFTLTCNLMQADASSSSVQLVMDAQMNPVMAMMAEKSLENFINNLVSRLKEVMEKPE